MKTDSDHLLRLARKEQEAALERLLAQAPMAAKHQARAAMFAALCSQMWAEGFNMEHLAAGILGAQDAVSVLKAISEVLQHVRAQKLHDAPPAGSA